MKKVLRVFLYIICVCLCLSALLIIIGGIYLYPYTKIKMDLSLLPENNPHVPSTLYVADASNRNYAPIASAYPMQHATYVTYEKMPPHLINAFVAIEDKRFFDHHGVDLWRTGQAFVQYICHHNTSFGGSTITQQLVKNVTLRDEKTPHRKLTEIFSALDLEKQLSKQEILEAYLNVINLANGCVGVGTASQYYFGKDIASLSLTECASLAAITQNPSYYDPYRHPDHNTQRRNTVLSEMYAQGYISLTDYEHATAKSLSLATHSSADNQTSWYTDMVISDVINDLQLKLGYSKEKATSLVYHGGLRIETAMDSTLQSILEAYYQDISNFPTGESGRPQSAMMVVDPTTGDILAVVGRIGEKSGYRIQNFATDAKRPVGSCIKPLSVYAPALQQGIIHYASLYEDSPVKSINGEPWPHNANGLYRGNITVKDAVANSTNTVAVKILEEVGLPTSFNFLYNKLHMKNLIPSDKQNAHDMTLSSLALGQESYGITLRELLGGYTICYDGIYRQPISYHKVYAASGELLLSNTSHEERVLSSENACILTHLLQEVTRDGTASSLSLVDALGIEVAGKTGTTQNNCDRWFVGLTPRLATAVWMGYEYPTEMRGFQGNPCLPIWDEVVSACELSYMRYPMQIKFMANPHVVSLSVCPHSGAIATPYCFDNISPPYDQTDVFTGWFKRSDLEHLYPCPLHLDKIEVFTKLNDCL